MNPGAVAIHRTPRLVALAALLIALAAVAGVVLLRASHPAARAPAAAVTHTGAITGRLLGVGGPAGPPRPLPHQTFELSRTAAGARYTIHTDSHGRFLIRAKPGDYRFSMPHMLIVTSVGVTAGTHRLFHVVAGRTIRRNITVSNPEWG